MEVLDLKSLLFNIKKKTRKRDGRMYKRLGEDMPPRIAHLNEFDIFGKIISEQVPGDITSPLAISGS